MDSDKKIESVESLGSAIKGGAVSRRWLLKNTANMAAGTVALSSLSATAAEPRAGAAIERTSVEYDPHANPVAPYNAAAFDGWESV